MDQLSDEFPVTRHTLYFNHAAVAPWPRRTAEAVNAFCRENVERGAQNYPAWLKVEQSLRRQLSELINAPSLRSIALAKSTSEALSLIANGMSWQSGDEIVITDQEFPSNRIVWEALSGQGVKTVVADITQATDPEAEILACLSPRTRLVSVSAVQYASGLRLNVGRLGDSLRHHPALFCVDAIQHLGALPFDAQACHADFVVADGHKWMLGPEGLALFYVRPEIMDQVRPSEFGWHMVRHRGDYTRKTWHPADDATRYECGSPNMLGIHALNASLSLLLETGMAQVGRMLTDRMNHLADALNSMRHVEFLTDTRPERMAGILTFRMKNKVLEAVHENLSEHGVVCALRGGGIRLSPHFYTPENQIDELIRLIAAA
ncbi:MAG: aminotransferase class V-fold PLP-dependent enzyme [Gammaproteobacteria bacterium]|nr:MAG: aminotransferase class V-fold PLP-dependent enzyme [Gammaproteobacteria bacterium]